MSRGMYDFFPNNPLYANSEKDWYVELLSSHPVWYDLVVDPPPELDTRNEIVRSLKDLSDQVRDQGDKRFVYFIVAREKIRFSSKRAPKYSLRNGTLTVYIEIGKRRKNRKISMAVSNLDRMQSIETTEKFITFTDKGGCKNTLPVHNFLQAIDIDLGLSTRIHYVGYTKNPWERPIKGEHRGLSETLYSISKEESDIFVYYNLFKVISLARNSLVKTNFFIANSVMDEVKVDQEGKIIESALILYFKPSSQMRSMQQESAIFENTLKKLTQVNKIKSVGIQIEVEGLTDYFRFGSDSVLPRDIHVFTCRLSDNCVEIVEGSDLLNQIID